MRYGRGFWSHHLTFVRPEIQGDLLLASMTGRERDTEPVGITGTILLSVIAHGNFVF